MPWWMWLAYFVLGVVAARIVRHRIPHTRKVGVYEKHLHEQYCDVRMFARNRCDCGKGRQGSTESLAPSAVVTTLATVLLWPLALLIAIIFLDPPRRKPLVTVEELDQLERELHIPQD